MIACEGDAADTLWCTFLEQPQCSAGDYPGLQDMFDNTDVAEENPEFARTHPECFHRLVDFQTLYTRLRAICERARVVTSIGRGWASTVLYEDTINKRIHVAYLGDELLFQLGAFPSLAHAQTAFAVADRWKHAASANYCELNMDELSGPVNHEWSFFAGDCDQGTRRMLVTMPVDGDEKG
jgi:hypothetical protein